MGFNMGISLEELLQIPGLPRYYLHKDRERVFSDRTGALKEVRGLAKKNGNIKYTLPVGGKYVQIRLFKIRDMVFPKDIPGDLVEIPGCPGYYISRSTKKVFSGSFGYMKELLRSKSSDRATHYGFVVAGKPVGISIGSIIDRTFPKEVPLGLVEVPGYPRYYVTKEGKLFSSKVTWNNPQGDFKECGSIATSGYWSHALWVNKKFERRYVHELVLLTFVGPRPEGPAGEHVRHLNGNKLDNRLENLAYGSWEENALDSIPLGVKTLAPGENHSDAKLTDDAVREIRRRRDAGELVRDIARDFPVDESNISRVSRRKSWKHVV